MSKRLAQLAVLLVLTAVTSISPATTQARPTASESASLDSIVRAPEVKLRKLHLVRPDLIPFPIYFEVYA